MNQRVRWLTRVLLILAAVSLSERFAYVSPVWWHALAWMGVRGAELSSGSP